MWHICGTSRNLNPPVAGSSGTCPVTFAQVKRLESGLIPSGTVLGQGHVAHSWHKESVIVGNNNGEQEANPCQVWVGAHVHGFV